MSLMGMAGSSPGAQVCIVETDGFLLEVELVHSSQVIISE